MQDIKTAAKTFPPFSNLAESVRATVIYFDLFDFAPTLMEVQRWLLKYNQAPATDEHTSSPDSGTAHQEPTLLNIERILKNSADLEHADGFYYIAGRTELPALRKTKYNYTEAKWQYARPYLRLLQCMPFVRGIWLSNSMGWQNARQQSDIDLLIITAPGHIWAARFFTTMLMKILRQRPGQQVPSKALCLSLYVSADHLNLEPYKSTPQDIHFAFWATQFFPIWDMGTFTKYTQRNPWLSDVFENVQWTLPSPARMLPEFTGISGVFQLWTQKILEFVSGFKASERMLKKLQLRILPQTLKELANLDTRVMLTDEILKFHTNDKREDIAAQWEARISAE